MEDKIKYILGQYKYFYICPNARVGAVKWNTNVETKTVTKVFYYLRKEMEEYLSKAVILGTEMFIIIPINGDKAWAGFTVNVDDIRGTDSMLYYDEATNTTHTMEHAK